MICDNFVQFVDNFFFEVFVVKFFKIYDKIEMLLCVVNMLNSGDSIHTGTP